jgi:PTS system cellobiose-specific IIB component
MRFQKAKIQELLPGIPVDAIDMRMYGRMDGAGVLKFAQEKMHA